MAVISGLSGSTPETLTGSSDNDIFDHKGGSDLLDGRGGSDTAWFLDSRNAYQVTTLAGVTHVKSLAGAASTYASSEAMLSNIEYLQFLDQFIPLATATQDVVFGQAGVGGEWLRGGTGDEIFDPAGLPPAGATRLAGSDWIDGGGGSDTVLYFDNRSNFTVTTLSGVTHVSAGSGSLRSQAILSNVEYIQFADQLVSLSGAAGRCIAGPLADPLAAPGDSDDIVDYQGSALIDGRSGTDTVLFFDQRDHFGIATQAGTIHVSGQAGADADYLGKDVALIDVERLQFADRKVALDLLPTERAGQALEFIGVLAVDLIDTPAVVGTILGYFDQGYSLTQLCQTAIDGGLVRQLAGSDSHADLARLAYRNVTGSEADATTVDALVGYLDGRYASFSQAQFLAAVAGLELNQQHIDLAGLQRTGVDYL